MYYCYSASMAVNVSTSGLISSGPSLREQARNVIRALIVTGQVDSDELISAPRLATQLEVSATPVREALLDLTREGLLEPVRNRGFRVVELTPKELNDIYAVRLLLEVPTVEAVAVSGVSKAQLEGLRRLAIQTQDRSDEKDLIGFLEADKEFHVGLVAALGNRALTELVATLRDRVRLRRLVGASGWKHIERSVGEHFEMIGCVEKRDGPGAGAATQRHLERARSIWLEQNGTATLEP